MTEPRVREQVDELATHELATHELTPDELATEDLTLVQRVSSGELPAEATVRTCPACGTPVVTSARFCHACGLPLSALRRQDSAERRVVTVLFGDLSDFTAWAEDLDPERVG